MGQSVEVLFSDVGAFRLSDVQSWANGSVDRSVDAENGNDTACARNSSLACRTIAGAFASVAAGGAVGSVNVWLMPSATGGSIFPACNQSLNGGHVTIATSCGSQAAEVCAKAYVTCLGCTSCFITGPENTQLTLRGLSMSGTAGIAVQYTGSLTLDHVAMFNHSGVLAANIPLDGSVSEASGDLTCTSSSFSDNVLNTGGLVHAGPSAVLDACVFERNTLMSSATSALLDLAASDSGNGRINVTLTDSVFSQNFGAGKSLIVLVNDMDTIIAQNSVFRDNAASGIAVFIQTYNLPSDSVPATIFASNASWINNTATSDDSGNLFVHGSSVASFGISVKVNNCFFASNWATQGGALIVFAFSKNANAVSINGSRFERNMAHSDGGALLMLSSVYGNHRHLGSADAVAQSIALSDVSFFENVAGGSGGSAAFYVGSSTISTINVSMSSNVAGRDGGAVAVFQSAESTWNMKGCSFTDNSAQGTGGAVSLRDSTSGVLWESSVFHHLSLIHI